MHHFMLATLCGFVLSAGLIACGEETNTEAAMTKVVDADFSSQRTLAIFGEGDFLEGLTFFEGDLLVNRLAGSNLAASVDRIDLSSGEVIGSASLPAFGTIDAKDGRVFATGASFFSQSAETDVLYELDPETLSPTVIVSFPPGTSANGVKVGPDGLLYVADSAQGLVWQVNPDDQSSKVWLDDPMLKAEDEQGLPGVNGLVWDGDSLYMTSTAQGLILKTTRSSAMLEVVARELQGDGLTVGPNHQLYVTTHLFRTVVRVDPKSGQKEVIADDLPGPADVIYVEALRSLFVANDGNFYANILDPSVPTVATPITVLSAAGVR